MKMCAVAMATGILTFALFLAVGIKTVSAPETAEASAGEFAAEETLNVGAAQEYSCETNEIAGNYERYIA